MIWRIFSCLVIIFLLHSDYGASQCVKCPIVDTGFEGDELAETAEHYNVHLVPHSHMDLGWLKTVEQYYYGTNAKVTTDAVQYIYDSVIRELSRNNNRRFIFVETGFLSLWWQRRGADDRNVLRKLVKEGRVEFVGGGFVMNDEACTRYENIIDQMAHGIEILQELFGSCGRVETGWQIDPFGHSKEFASILADMNYKYLLFGRIDYQEKKQRQMDCNMEFSWKLDQQKNITVSVLPNNYAPPPGFCYDVTCTDPILVDDKNSEEFNIQERAETFVQWVKNNSKFYRSNNLLVTMGEDFNYLDAYKWFSNMDLLINFINDNNFTIAHKGRTLKVNLVYSTPTCYMRSAKQQLSVNEADFFPYGFPDGHSYWTGYFTSRPSFKYLVRWSTSVYKAASQILAEIGVSVKSLAKLRRALSIAQHHDAITGTAKQFVNDNYVKLLGTGIEETLTALETAFGQSLGFCHQLNASRCEVVENLPRDGIITVLYNPLAFNVTYNLRLPLRQAGILVQDEQGNQMPNVITLISDAVFDLAERQTSSRYEVTIEVELSPMSFRQLSLIPSRPARNPKVESKKSFTKSRIKATNGIEVGIGHNGLEWIEVRGKRAKLSQSFGYYQSFCSNTSRSSGAYVFRPDGPRKAISLMKTKKITNKMFIEVQQTFTNGVAQNIRVYKNQPFIELDWIIGPIDVSDNIGKEFVTTIHLDEQSGEEFFTDSNGRGEIRRIRNHRTNWNLSLSEPVAGNYYPVNSKIFLRNGMFYLTILTDRPQGGTSLQPGSIEMLLHRRCLCDDHFGVEEALNEPGFNGKGLQTRGTFRLFYEDDIVSRINELEFSTPPFVFFTHEHVPTGISLLDVRSWEDKLHVLTLENINAQRYLIRLENVASDKSDLFIDVNKLITQRFLSVVETNLDGYTPKHSVSNFTLRWSEIKSFILLLS